MPARLSRPRPHACSRPRPHLAGPGRAAGLLPAAAFHLRAAHRHAGAVQSRVHRRCRAGRRLDDGAFVGGDLASRGFGGAFDLPGVDPHPGQLARQFARPGEAAPGRRPDHLPGGGRQRFVLQAPRPVARTPPRPAGVAVVPGPFQTQGAERAREGLPAAAGTARRTAAGAGRCRTGVVASVRVQPALRQPRGDRERFAAHRLLDGLRIAAARARGCQGADFRVDFRADFGCERFPESPFLTASAVCSEPGCRRRAANLPPGAFSTASAVCPHPGSSRASLSASLTSINSCDRRRKRRYSAFSASIFAPACAGMMRVTVLPHRLRVSDRIGSCPDPAAPAQRARTHGPDRGLDRAERPGAGIKKKTGKRRRERQFPPRGARSGPSPAGTRRPDSGRTRLKGANQARFRQLSNA